MRALRSTSIKPRIDVARDEKAGGRPGDAADLGPEDAPPDAEQQPGDNREQGARDEDQARHDVEGEKSQRGCRIAVDRGGDRKRDREPPSSARRRRAPIASRPKTKNRAARLRRTGARSAVDASSIASRVIAAPRPLARVEAGFASMAASPRSSGRAARRFSHITPNRSTMPTPSRSKTPYFETPPRRGR